MRFLETKLKGAWIIEPELAEDARGVFARTFCQREFEAHRLNPRVAQCSRSFNPRRGTLRGMHYQIAPHEEAKLIRCVRGAIYDVAIDARRSSSTFTQWVAVELTAQNARMLYVPEGVPHGFQTLADDTEVLYQMSEFHHPECARGLRWDDPAFGVAWPLRPPTVMSEQDQSYELFDARIAAAGS